jgi:DsbC/DsbD-like thiol-disulfide interchange protein
MRQFPLGVAGNTGDSNPTGAALGARSEPFAMEDSAMKPLFTNSLVIVCAALLAAAAAPVNAADATKSDSVVKIETNTSKPDADGKQVVTLTLTIDKGWHLYANPAPKDFPGVPVEVKVTGKTKPASVRVDYPEGKEVKDATIGDYKVYEDKADIKVTVQRAKGDTEPLELNVKLQACTDKKCLLPATVKVSVP